MILNLNFEVGKDLTSGRTAMEELPADLTVPLTNNEKTACSFT
jgi:hypothetical protein